MIPLWIKGVAAAFIVVAIAAIGWRISSWRTGYIDAIALKAELVAAYDTLEMEKSERERVDLLRTIADAKVLDYQESERALNDRLKAKVVSVVADRRACDLGADVVGLLNDARGYRQVPGTPSGGGNIPETITKDHGLAVDAAASD